VSFYRAMLALIGAQDNTIHSRQFQSAGHLFSSLFRKVIGEKPPVAHDQAHRHLLVRHEFTALLNMNQKPNSKTIGL
jgi:hypothetical protein